MTFLIDTHVWLWWMTDPDRLSASALHLIKDPASTVLFSAVVSWEIAVKYAIGKLPLPEPPERYVPPRIERDSLTSLPIQHSHTLHTAALPFHHRDPFDRLLIAQAQVERVPVMTVDPAFTQYDVETIDARIQ